MVEDDEVCDDGGQDCAEDCSGEGCNPLSQVGCDAGDMCYALHFEPDCVPDTPGLPGAGEPCIIEDTTLPACAPGLACWGSENLPGCQGESCCTPLCHLMHPDCADGLTCRSRYSSPYPQANYVGVCIDYP